MVDTIKHTFRSNALVQIANDAIRFLESTPSHSLPPRNSFPGAGVYLIYYRGSHPDYAHIANTNKPIYVGKAVPSGWRTGQPSNPSEAKLKLRLSEHARSIRSAANLELNDFECRFIIIPMQESAIISVIESSLIKKLQPIWNTRIDGFGNHDPGKGRYQQARSEWDRKHPGRPWAERLQS